MKLDLVFGLVALIPAGLNPAPGHGSLLVALCAPGSAVTSVPVPLRELPLSGSAGCCAKGCHAAPARRRAERKAAR